MLVLLASKRISIWLIASFRSVSLSFSCMSSPKMSSRIGAEVSTIVYVGHILLESSRLASFLKRLVQRCFCRRWSLPGVLWPHCKASSSRYLWSFLKVYRFSRMCNVVCGSGHCKSISWTAWRPGASSDSPLSFNFLYTKGAVPQVRVAWLPFYTGPSLRWSPRIALFFSAVSVRYKFLNDILLVLKVPSQLSGAFSGLLAAAIENMNGIGGRPGWAWIFIVVCFDIFFEVTSQSSTTYVYRKDCFQLSLVSLASSLFPRHHMISSFSLRTRNGDSL